MSNINNTMADSAVQDAASGVPSQQLGGHLLADPELIQGFCGALMQSGEVHELRVVKVASGYYDDPETAAACAALLSDGDGPVPPSKAVYLTLNPVNPALPERLGFAVNGDPKTASQATGDGHITRRRNLLIDVDPVRRGAKADDSATDAERDAALAVRDQIRGYLAGLGWPEPAVVSMSGNGGGIIYRVDLPNDQEATRLVEGVLRALAARFNDDKVGVDTKTGNASRITKIVGTVARKGANTPERPWRLATGEFNLGAEPVPIECLRAAASEDAVRADGHATDIRTRLRALGIAWQEKPHDYGTVLSLDRCLTSEAHTEGAYVTEFLDGGLDYGCHHDSCAGKGWADVAAVLGDRPAKGGGGGKEPSQATFLVRLAEAERVALFHAPDDRTYGTFAVGTHRETHTLRSKGFKRYLSRLFYAETGKAPGSQAITDALGVLEARATYDGAERSVFTRLAGHGGNIYLDLGNDAWEAVKITPDGWRVVTDPPVRFRRPRGMLPLPHPVAGGSVEELRLFVNVAGEDEWRLLLGWLVHTLRPTGPYAVLGLHGEQGSAKSTTSRVLRALVDPNVAPIRAEPREVRDFMIAATNSHLVAFDNLSYLQDWQSDALCRLATGGGFATRELYSDDEEIIFETMRPVVLNGIGEAATKSDLLDRSVLIDLPNIPAERRRDEAAFWASFEKARPRILGALLDATSTALRNLPMTSLERMPRMADFALWVMAAEPAFGWAPGTFLAAYGENREEAHERGLEAEPIVPVLRRLFDPPTAAYGAAMGADPNLSEDGSEWRGTATELLQRLERLDQLLGTGAAKKRGWPKNGWALSTRLRRIAPNLRTAGFEFGDERTGKKRTLILRTTAGNGDSDTSDAEAAAPDPPASHPHQRPDGGSDAGDARDTPALPASPSDEDEPSAAVRRLAGPLLHRPKVAGAAGDR